MTGFVFGILFSGPTFAQDSVTIPVVGKVEAKYAKVDVIQADFVQKIKSEVFGEETQRGEMIIKRPAKMKWDFTSGQKQFITNGETMWIYTKTNNQVIRYKDVSNSRSTADSLLQSLDNLQSVFNVAVAEGKNSGHVLNLSPKDGSAQFKSVQLTVNSSFVVQKVMIVDAVDTVTTLEFSDVKLNSDVPDSTFEFSVPAGADVVDAGGF
jgi:outer membrane lipoprotein carrier protein